MRGALLILILMVAGCVDSEDPSTAPEAPAPDDDAGDRTAMAGPYAIEGCRQIELPAPGDAATLRAFVPEHFSVPDNPLAILGVMLCDADLARGFFAIQVEPNHPDLVSDRAAGHYWMPQHFAVEGSLFAAALEDVHGTFLDTHILIGGSPIAASFSMEAANTTLTWTADGPIVPGAWPIVGSVLAQTNSFREYFPADGGYAYIDGTFGSTVSPSSNAGPAIGTLSVTGTGPAAEYYEPSSTQAGLYATGLAYAEAEIGFIPFPQ